MVGNVQEKTGWTGSPGSSMKFFSGSMYKNPDVYVLELPECMRMNNLNLKTPKAEGIILGLIIAVVLTVSRIPPGFALVVGIIFGVVAFFVLDERTKER
jgi:hypothetical protein